ncbi:MAG: hypothetical protein KAR06_00405 [Deltaproteobacteria bacterium]|nr:hypothetical protein [Deltaproteobacteria bacterium]
MAKKIFKFEQGTAVECLITKFKGVVIGRCEYLTGCAQYLVKPTKCDAGKMPSSQWIDEAQLKKGKGKDVVLPAAKEAPGGDMPDCPGTR